MTGRGDWILVRVAVFLYRVAILALPRDFRADYGGELAACFERSATEARERGPGALTSVTARSLGDLFTRAPARHLAAARAGALGRVTGWSGTLQDVRQAGRRMLRHPSFAAASVLTLALGIAAATSIFSLVHGVVLSPLDHPDSDRIVVVDHGGSGIGVERGLGVTYGFYRFYAERVRAAEAMSMYSTFNVTLTGRGEPVRLYVITATPSLREVLRFRPRLGRWFAAEDARPEAPLTVVLSYDLWQERFGGDASVIGTTAEIDGQTREVIGVMPRSFGFPDRDVELWLPRTVPQTGIGGWNDLAVARLAPGATPGGLETELESLLPILRTSNDDPARVEMYLDEARITPRIVTLKESMVGDIRGTLWILLGTVGFVLLIAVANVANLFLVRAEEGHRERAVRAALGADAGRLLRGYLAETLLIAGAAGALGVALAGGAIRLIRLGAPVSVPRLDEVGLDPVVLAATVGACLLSALLLGLIPALRQGGDLTVDLKESGGRTTAGRARLRGRNVLVAAQVALALVLLVGSGLLFRTFQELRSVDLGFAERQALTFEIGLPEARYETHGEARDFHARLLPRLAAIPGVQTAAAIGRCLPLAGHMCWGETLEAEGRPVPEGQVPPVIGARIATPDYFRALGIRVRGRTFEAADETGPFVAILSEAGAAAYFPGEDPIGRRVRFGTDSPWLTVVGVAGDTRGRVATDDFLRAIYLPVHAEPLPGPPPSFLSYVLRTSVPAASIAPAVRHAVADVDPSIPVARVRTLEELIASATAPAAFALTLIGLAAGMALLLGAVGVYAVVSYAVSRRTAEIGVRMALGARSADVRSMVLREGGGVVLVGVGLGLLAALATTRLMGGMLFGISARDPLSYVGVTLVMLAVAMLALYLPARRASRIEPQQALRSE